MLAELWTLDFSLWPGYIPGDLDIFQITWNISRSPGICLYCKGLYYAPTGHSDPDLAKNHHFLNWKKDFLVLVVDRPKWGYFHQTRAHSTRQTSRSRMSLLPREIDRFGSIKIKNSWNSIIYYLNILQNGQKLCYLTKFYHISPFEIHWKSKICRKRKRRKMAQTFGALWLLESA